MAGYTKIQWECRGDYDIALLADGHELASEGSQAQLFRFRKGKFAHYHKQRTELFYFTSGHGRAVIDGDECELKAGVSLLIKPGVKHSFINDLEDTYLEGVLFKTNIVPDDVYDCP